MKAARGSSWAGIAVVLGANATLLFGAVGVGINVPFFPRLAPLPSMAVPDYSRMPDGGFEPLRDAFIAEALGIDLPAREPSALADRGSDEVAEPILAAGSQPPPSDNVLGGAHPLTNDDFDRAYGIERIPFTASTNSAPASREPAEPDSCSPVGTTVWYRYRSPVTVELTADTFGSDYALTLGVFRGPGFGSLEMAGCDRDAQGSAHVGFLASAGSTHYVQVTAPVRGGRLVFNLDFRPLITRATIGPAGQQSHVDVTDPWLSENGRFVVFSSDTTGWGYEGIEDPPTPGSGTDDLVALWEYARCNGEKARATGSAGVTCEQVYVRDRLTHRTEIVSLSSAGRPVRDGGARPGDISNDGCLVTFATPAADVAPGGPSGFDERREDYRQIYVRDRCRGTTELVSIGVDGRYADGHAYGAGLSANGRYVSIWSPATNLVPGGIDDDGDWDVFQRDLWTGRTEQVSVATSGAQQQGTGPSDRYRLGGATLMAQSWSGRYLVFRSKAANLDEERPDTNGKMDVFLRDMKKKTTIRVSVSSEEEEANADSLPTVNGVGQAVSDDGRYVLFLSDASNLVSDDTNGIEDLFLRDTVLGITTRVSVNSDEEEAEEGPPAEDPSWWLGNPGAAFRPTRETGVGYTLSGDGRFAVWSSSSPNLVRGDTNGVVDVFLRDFERGTTTRVSLTRDGAQSDFWSSAPRISGDGRFIAFISIGETFVEDDTNEVVDIFVVERPGLGGVLSGWW